MAAFTLNWGTALTLQQWALGRFEGVRQVPPLEALSAPASLHLHLLAGYFEAGLPGQCWQVQAPPENHKKLGCPCAHLPVPQMWFEARTTKGYKG